VAKRKSKNPFGQINLLEVSRPSRLAVVAAKLVKEFDQKAVTPLSAARGSLFRRNAPTGGPGRLLSADIWNLVSASCWQP
jgi:hypothetical protein